MGSCPNCGSSGEDLIFAFYCSNPSCKNYKALESDKKGTDNEGFLPCRLHVDDVYMMGIATYFATSYCVGVYMMFSVYEAQPCISNLTRCRSFQLVFNWDDEIKVIPAFTHYPNKKLFTDASYKWISIVGNARSPTIRNSIADESIGWRKNPRGIYAFKDRTIDNAIYKPPTDNCPISVKIKDCFCNEFVQLT